MVHQNAKDTLISPPFFIRHIALNIGFSASPGKMICSMAWAFHSTTYLSHFQTPLSRHKKRQNASKKRLGFPSLQCKSDQNGEYLGRLTDSYAPSFLTSQPFATAANDEKIPIFTATAF